MKTMNGNNLAEPGIIYPRVPAHWEMEAVVRAYERRLKEPLTQHRFGEMSYKNKINQRN